MSSVPSHAELLDAVGQRFTFGSSGGAAVEALLVHAPAGIPMNERFVCYSATFELPMGTHLPQDIYRIVSPSGRAWDLLATPTQPAADGRSTLTFVVHCRADELADAAGSRSVT